LFCKQRKAEKEHELETREENGNIVELQDTYILIQINKRKPRCLNNPVLRSLGYNDSLLCLTKKW